MQSPYTIHHPSHPKPLRPKTWLRLARRTLAVILALAATAVPPLAGAATIWTGPTINFSKTAFADPTQAANQDQMTPNVWITRASTMGIYNAKTESSYTHNVSPADTEWAYGTTAIYSTLTYQPWEVWNGGSGGGPPSTVNQDAVLHLISEDIYLDIKFTSWGGPGGAFSYTRSTPAPANLPPSVTLTNPPDNSVFGNTDRITIAADASDADGSVTNVQFFDGAVLLGSDSTSPFSLLTVSFTFDLGPHTLTAVAYDNLGAAATSAPVHLTIERYLPPLTNGSIALFLQPVATNLAAPLYGISPPGDTHRLFVVEQNGLLLIIHDGVLLPSAALDIQSRVQPPLNPSNPNDERGFLGLAFHPGFNNPGSPGYQTLFTYNSETNAATPPTYPAPAAAANNYKNVVNEWKISVGDTNVVDPASRREVISFGKNAGNHNGGTIAFGPDDYLYLALGDGGNANDVGTGHIEPGGNAQDLSTPLGKMLRFDPLHPSLTPGSSDPVSANGQYRIPTTNPFQGPGEVPEIYAYGLRNPFRFCFDPVTGDLILADVGQNNVEEIDRIVLGGNYGWAVKEGDFLFNRTNGPAGDAGTIGTPPGNRSPGVPAGMIDPIAGPMGTLEYDHNDGISITGGFVYRGAAMPELYGKYIFGDLALIPRPTRINGRLFYADLDAGTINAFPLAQFSGTAVLPNGLTVHGFGQDGEGELYALVTNTSADGNGGIVYKLLPVRLEAQASGGVLDLSWPAAGPRLEAQANGPGVGITANWNTVPGSAATNHVVIPINPANGSGFFRLVVP